MAITSKGRVPPIGMTPTAIASATMASILPELLFFDNLRFDSSFESTTAFIAHQFKTGPPP